jgi:hypothetical protein
VGLRLAPVGQQAPGVRDRAQAPAVQPPIAKAAMAALVMAVRPWTARRTDVGLTRRLAQPGGDGLRQARGALVTRPRHRRATVGQQPLPSRDAIACGDRAGPGDGRALTPVGIQARQALPPPSRRLSVDKRIASAMARVLCPGQPGRAAAAGARSCPLGGRRPAGGGPSRDARPTVPPSTGPSACAPQRAAPADPVGRRTSWGDMARGRRPPGDRREKPNRSPGRLIRGQVIAWQRQRHLAPQTGTLGPPWQSRQGEG